MNVATHRIRVVGAVLLATVLLGACSTQAPRVDCERRLQPINRPVVAAAATRGQLSSGARP